MSKREKHPPLQERRITDENFHHTMQLVGPCAAWMEAIPIGHKIDWNDLNLIKIPAEIALGFIRDAANEQGERGEAARKALELFEAMRAAGQQSMNL